MGIPDHLTCLLRNLYAGQEATVRTGHWTVKWSEVAQLYLTLCDPMDCGLPGSSVHGIFQARKLEWVAISFTRRSYQPRDRTQVSHIVGRHFTIWTIREVSASWNNRLLPNRKRSTSGCILSPCLFNSYVEYITRNTGLEEAQAAIKIARRTINNLTYADDTTLMAESEMKKWSHSVMSNSLQPCGL